MEVLHEQVGEWIRGKAAHEGKWICLQVALQRSMLDAYEKREAERKVFGCWTVCGSVVCSGLNVSDRLTE